MRHFDASDDRDDPERAVALLNSVLSDGGDLAAIEQALAVVVLALQRAGFGKPVKPPRRCGH